MTVVVPNTGADAPLAEAPSEYGVFLSRRLLEDGWRFFGLREKAVVPVLLMHLPNVFPGLARIAEYAGVSPATAKRAIASLAEVQFLTRKQRRPQTGRFGTNEYVLVGLSDQEALDRLLRNLKRRGSPVRCGDRGSPMRHGSAAVDHQRPADRGSPVTHKVIIKEEKKIKSSSSVGRRATRNGAAKSGGGEGGFSLLRLDDDDRSARLLLELPDHAAEPKIVAALTKRGVHRGRAYKLAQHSQMNAALLRDRLARSDCCQQRNPGGYVATVVQEALDEALEAARRAAAEHVDERLAEIERMHELIQTMPVAQLAEVVKLGSHTLREIAPETVRSDRAFRGELARWLAWHPEVLNGDSPCGDSLATH